MNSYSNFKFAVALKMHIRLDLKAQNPRLVLYENLESQWGPKYIFLDLRHQGCFMMCVHALYIHRPLSQYTCFLWRFN